METRLCFEFTHVRLSALRKLIFGVHGVQEMFFLSFERLNFKTKVVDNIPNYFFAY